MIAALRYDELEPADKAQYISRQEGVELMPKPKTSEKKQQSRGYMKVTLTIPDKVAEEIQNGSSTPLPRRLLAGLYPFTLHSRVCLLSVL